MDIAYSSLSHLIKLHQYCELARIKRRESYENPPIPGVFKVTSGEWELVEQDKYEGTPSFEAIQDIEKWKYAISEIRHIRPNDHIFVKHGNPVKLKVLSIEITQNKDTSWAEVVDKSGHIDHIRLPGRAEKEWSIKTCTLDGKRFYVLSQHQLETFKFIRNKDNE